MERWLAPASAWGWGLSYPAWATIREAPEEQRIGFRVLSP